MMETDTVVGSSIRVTVDRDELAAGLQLVSRAASARGTVQVLGGVAVRAAEGLLELEATDMDGAIGHIKFGKDHQVVFGLDPKTTALGAVFQWRDKQRVPVFPPDVAEGKIELPSQ